MARTTGPTRCASRQVAGAASRATQMARSTPTWPQRRERGIDFLPQTLQEAVQAFAADPLVERTLGKELRDEFITYKTQEWEAYHLSVSQWEVERYSHMF